MVLILYIKNEDIKIEISWIGLTLTWVKVSGLAPTK